MAETKDQKLTVAYLTMCWQRDKTMNAFKNCEEQHYPDELKTLHLLHQEPYPNPIQHKKKFNLMETNVIGKWPDLWAFKVEAFLKAVKSDITIWFDEDDRFEPDYTLKCLQSLDHHDIAWNHLTEFVTRDTVEVREFKVGSGTLVIRTEVLRELWGKFRKQHPSTNIRVLPNKYFPIDGPFYFLWSADSRCTFHQGIRSYFLHRESAGSVSWDEAALLESDPRLKLARPGVILKGAKS